MLFVLTVIACVTVRFKRVARTTNVRLGKGKLTDDHAITVRPASFESGKAAVGRKELFCTSFTVYRE